MSEVLKIGIANISNGKIKEVNQLMLLPKKELLVIDILEIIMILIVN